MCVHFCDIPSHFQLSLQILNVSRKGCMNLFIQYSLMGAFLQPLSTRGLVLQAILPKYPHFWMQIFPNGHLYIVSLSHMGRLCTCFYSF